MRLIGTFVVFCSCVPQRISVSFQCMQCKHNLMFGSVRLRPSNHEQLWQYWYIDLLCHILLHYKSLEHSLSLHTHKSVRMMFN